MNEEDSVYYSTRAIYKKEDDYFVIGINSGGKWAPIGLRLSKKNPLPDYPIYCSNEREAKIMCEKWQTYFDSQKVKRKKKRIARMKPSRFSEAFKLTPKKNG